MLTKTSATDYATNWQTPSAGGLTLPLNQNLTFVDNTWDIGTSTDYQPRNLYLAGAARVSGTLLVGGVTTLNTLNFGIDNTYDIGAAAANRPRDLYLGRDATISRSVGIGSAPITGFALYVAGTLSAASSYGASISPTFGSAVTTIGYGLSVSLTTQSTAFTMGAGAGVNIGAPQIGAGSSVTTMYGLFVGNQGRAGVTNAYGVYINPQSGAGTTNIGLFNAGRTRLDNHLDWLTDNTYDIGASGVRPRDLYLGRQIALGPSGGVNLRLLSYAPQGLLIEAPTDRIAAWAKTGASYTANAYFDGTNWSRYDTASAAALLSLGPGAVSINAAPAGSGAIAWTQLLYAANGTLQLQAGSTQKLIGSYFNVPAWSTTTTNAYVATPITVTVTTTGGMLRVEWQCQLYHSAINAGVLIAIAKDGVLVGAPVGGGNMNAVNNINHYSGVWYAQYAAGTYTFAIWINNLSVGTLSQWNGCNAAIYVTEQKNP